MPPVKQETTKKDVKPRADGRRTLLVYMDAGLIKEVKKAALDAEKNVYEIVEDATRDWLKKVNASHARSSGKKSNERKVR